MSVLREIVVGIIGLTRERRHRSETPAGVTESQKKQAEACREERMKPIYYAIFAINGFTALIWILFFVNAFIRNRLFFKSSFIDRYTLKVKDDSLSLVGNTLKEDKKSENVRERRENDSDEREE